jgi:fructose-1,6-bisphosphatase/inositol monophosphatase family enzyme
VFISNKIYGFWDVCAGHCLAKELGGGLYHINGDEISYSLKGDYYLQTGYIWIRDKSKLSKVLDIIKENNIYF